MSEPENVCMMHIYDKIFQIPIMKSTFPLSLSKLVVVIPQESPITYKTLEYLKVEGDNKDVFCRIKQSIFKNHQVNMSRINAAPLANSLAISHPDSSIGR